MRHIRPISLAALMIAIILFGIGYVQTRWTIERESPRATVQQTNVEKQDPETNVTTTPTTIQKIKPTATILMDGEIGFTVVSPEGWGTFTVTKETDELGEVLYRGIFSNRPNVTYHAVDASTVYARGGYPGDVMGYTKTDSGFQINTSGKYASDVPGTLVANEEPLANGNALLIQGTTNDGPSPFPNDIGELVAYLNVSHGPLPGGVFIAEPSVTVEDMRAMLLDITLVE